MDRVRDTLEVEHLSISTESATTQLTSTRLSHVQHARAPAEPQRAGMHVSRKQPWVVCLSSATRPRPPTPPPPPALLPSPQNPEQKPQLKTETAHPSPSVVWFVVNSVRYSFGFLETIVRDFRGRKLVEYNVLIARNGRRDKIFPAEASNLLLVLKFDKS